MDWSASGLAVTNPCPALPVARPARPGRRGSRVSTATDRYWNLLLEPEAALDLRIIVYLSSLSRHEIIGA